jgi:4-hydroxybenzoate polyprenyltransferase
MALLTASMVLAAHPTRARAIIGSVLFVAPLFYLYIHPQLTGLYIIIGALGFLLNNGLGAFVPRRVPLVKNLGIAALWVAATCGPYALLAPDFDMGKFTYAAIVNFLLMLCVDVFADIHTADHDKTQGFKTIPNTFGLNAAKGLCIACIIAVALYIATLSWPPALLLLIAYAVLIGFVVRANPARSELYFQSLTLLWIVMTIVPLVVTGDLF